MSEIETTPTPTPIPTIEPITVDLQDTEIARLKELIRSRRYTNDWRNEKIMKQLGGICCLCGGLASQIVSYDCSGATRIERYCDECVQKTFSRSSESKKV
jgi:hypothetical protein